MDKEKDLILVTGATGYVAGRLVPLLLARGYRVRAMGRSLKKMAARPWGQHGRVQLVRGDIMDLSSLERAADGCSVVYYLVHSMMSRKGRFRGADQTGARNMAEAARACGVARLIYLGGLGEADHPHLSDHLKSRNEVGKILSQGAVPVTTLRAAMIIGSGSASFEILRYLAERLPLMVTPRWVDIPTQPIAVSNVLVYLVGCLEHKETAGKTYDIGGPEVVSFRELFKIFASRAGIPTPLMIPVPFLSPRLSALWIHLVTPVPASIARPLTEGLRLPTICEEEEITRIIPQTLLTCRQAIGRALDRVRQEQVDTCWADAGEAVPPEWSHCGDSDYSGGTLLECGYRARVAGSASHLWPSVARLGGQTGYYAADILWWLRGVVDRLLGGVGLRRGRRSAEQIRPGDPLDFWRVLEVAPPEGGSGGEGAHASEDALPLSKLVLLGEMKTPGQALLEVSIQPLGKDDAGREQCRLSLLARFLPRGIFGIAYWYLLYPVHQYIFSNMLRGMAGAAGLNLAESPLRFTPKISPSLRRKFP